MTDTTDIVNERNARNCWSRGIDWCVFKDGRKWRTAEYFGFTAPFKTKTAAYDACTDKVLASARRDALARAIPAGASPHENDRASRGAR